MWMKHVSQIIFENSEAWFLIYLRDSAIDKPYIPFPDCHDLIGWHQEAGETPEQALKREIEEEIWLIAWKDYTYELYKVFECPADRDVYPNIKHIFKGTLSKNLNELVLTEWQELLYVSSDKLLTYTYANMIWDILQQYLVDTDRFI